MHVREVNVPRIVVRLILTAGPLLFLAIAGEQRQPILEHRGLVVDVGRHLFGFVTVEGVAVLLVIRRDVGIDFRARIEVGEDLANGFDRSIALTDDLVNRNGTCVVDRAIRAGIIRVGRRVGRAREEGPLRVGERLSTEELLVGADLLNAEQELALHAQEIELHHGVDVVRLTVAIIAGKITGADIPVGAVGVGRGDCAALADGVILRLLLEEVVANIEPAEWAEIGGHREVLDRVVEDSTAAGVIEGLVMITFAVLVGDVGTALDAGVGWQAPIAGRDTLVVDIGGVGERWGRGVLNDVGRQKIACIGCDRVGQGRG